MSLLSKKIGPLFLKESSDAEKFIAKLQELRINANADLQKEIDKQINLAKYGAQGERNVAFELKNSGMDMYILHDIYLEINGLSAQIDYMVFTHKRIYIIECKNLIGNIDIDNQGNFIRSYELFGKKIREGIYSPVTQNQRHLLVLKEIRKATKKNFLSKILFEENFEEKYKSIVVLANPKTVLNARYAKKDVKNQVIRADQLITYIKEQDASKQVTPMSANEMKQLAQFFLDANQSEHADYSKKYQDIVKQIQESPKEQKSAEVKMQEVKGQAPQEKVFDETTTNREVIIKRLKAFRWEQSNKEKVKPYYIFNDAQMNDLIEKNPSTKEELLEVSGFGAVKVKKYGEAILNCLRAD